jgi:hypothetical protein
MKFPAFPLMDHLEMDNEGHVAAAGSIDPLHIVALHAERSWRSTSSRSRCGVARNRATVQSRLATAPAKTEQGGLGIALPEKPSTAPLPELKPLLPSTAKLPTPRRWRQRTITGRHIPTPCSRSKSNPRHSLSPTESDVDGNRALLNTSVDLERSDFDNESIDGRGLATPSSPHRPFSDRVGTAEAEIMRTGRRFSEAGDSATGSIEAGGSLDYADTLLSNSLEESSRDPLAAGLSLANLSTALDENSIWDQMWSVLGSGPSESVMETELSQVEDEPLGKTAEKHAFTTPWPQVHRPVSKVYGRPGSFGHALMRPGPVQSDLEATKVPGQHRPLRPKVREAVAQKALRESTPLHVRSIERFIHGVP